LEVIIGVYGGSLGDAFYKVAVDSNNNIIAVGNTYSEGADQNALIVKFDSNLNILYRKIWNNSVQDHLWSVTVDHNNNIFCVGYTYAGTGLVYPFVIKLDQNLSVVARKYFTYTNYHSYMYGVTIDNNNNVIICGAYGDQNIPNSWIACVIKLDNNLNAIAKVDYYGNYTEAFRLVTVDHENNIICAGYTFSEGSGSPTYENALVVKYNSSLTNILARKVFSGSNAEQFNAVTVDHDNNIICAGYSYSEMAGACHGIVIKFDTSLNIILKKRYGRAADTVTFESVVVDSNNNIICAGKSNQGLGISGIIVKLNSNFTLLSQKFFDGTGTGTELFLGVALDASDNIICVGYTDSHGIGSPTNNNCLALKIESDIPIGTSMGTGITSFTLKDGYLTLEDSTLTLSNSTMTSQTCYLNMGDLGGTFSNSTSPYEKDIIKIS
jgi:hypothetical protein